MDKKIAFFFVILILSCCTSLNQLDYYKEVDLASIVSIGDKISVTLQNGDTHYLKVVSIADNEMVGTLLQVPDVNLVSIDLKTGPGITIKVEDIEYIEVETIDGGKTTLAIMGGIVLIPIALVGIFFGALGGAYQ